MLLLFYTQMNELMDKYGPKGLVILGFPCNQFGHQENTANEEILNSLKYVRPGNNFLPKMKILGKLDVNGEKADPLFVYLKDELPVTHPDGASGLLMQDQRSIIWNPVRRNDISWNFEKFLIDRTGKPFQRYNRHFETKDIASDIEKLLD